MPDDESLASNDILIYYKIINHFRINFFFSQTIHELRFISFHLTDKFTDLVWFG